MLFSLLQVTRIISRTILARAVARLRRVVVEAPTANGAPTNLMGALIVMAMGVLLPMAFPIVMVLVGRARIVENSQLTNREVS